MKRKLPGRIGALLLAMALAVSLAAPAAAAASTSMSVSLKANGQAVENTTLAMKMGDSPVSISAEVADMPADATASYQWTCGAPVSLQGAATDTVQVSPVSVGEAEVQVTVAVSDSNGGTETLTASCKIQVSAADPVTVASVEIVPSTLNLVAGGADSEVLTARVTMSDGSDYKGAVAWKCEPTSVAEIDTLTRKVTPKAQGAATVTATAEGVEGTCAVTVAAAPAASGVNNISLSPTTLVMEKNTTRRITATITPDTATNKNISWVSSDPEVATLKDGGSEGVIVEAKSPGKTIITATTEDGGKTAQCEVEVSGVTITQPDKPLMVNGGPLQLEYGVFGAAKEGALSWASSAEHIISVNQRGTVSGLSVGKSTITVSVYKTGYSASCEISVEEDVANAINRSLKAGEKMDFPGLLADLNSRCQEKTEAALDYITNLRVDTKQGVLYYRYASPDTPNHGVGGVDRYYYSAASGSGRQAISDLTFVPDGSFSGTAEIEYTGYSTKGDSFHGTIQVEVQSTGDVMYSTAKNTPLTLEAKTFKDICQIKTGRSASYITFTQPNATRGTLYYNYSPIGQWSQKVDGNTKYYISSTPSLEKVTFVPAENYTGTVTVSYRCTDTTGGSYSGTMTINVYAAEGSGGSGGVEYTTGIGRQVTLNSSDFNAACQDANDRSLSYVYFDSLPNTSQGILYYNYTSSSSSRVDTSTRYNRANTGSRISYITFVPASGFSGDVTVPYTGYDTAGQSYKDNLVIHVTDAAGVVYYTTGQGQAVTFQAEDFNDACQQANGSTLNYLYFDSLPSASAGTLYRNYRNSSSTGTRVTTSQRYSRGGTPSVSDVTFVPKSSYAGTVSIPFIGYDASGARFDGSVNITVGQVSGRVVSYSTASGGVVNFSASDFNSVCRAVTGDNLEYVSFDLPASQYGTLYYQYNSSRDTGTRVSSSNTYYRSGGARLLDDVSFAAANTNSVASFTYTARSTGGERFTGTVEIAIGSAASGSAAASSGTNYIGSSTPISLRTVDFESACRAGTGGTLSHIRLTGLPDETTGHLYMSYASPSKPGALATLTANYTAGGGLSIGELSFVPRAGYQGQVSIPYTGYDTQGASFTGSITINVSSSYCATPFYDVDAGWEWAMPSVEFLRAMGVTNGYSDNTFRPSRSISRGEFVLMVCRAFGFDTSSKVSSFPDVPESSVYAGAVATARSMGIVEGSGGRFNPNSAITRQSAMTMLCRAMRAAGKKVPSAASSTLDVYVDHARVGSYARESVASLVRMGVVQGGSDMRLNPTQSISRAQMAAILHRALTI